MLAIQFLNTISNFTVWFLVACVRPWCNSCLSCKPTVCSLKMTQDLTCEWFIYCIAFIAVLVSYCFLNFVLCALSAWHLTKRFHQSCKIHCALLRWLILNTLVTEICFVLYSWYQEKQALIDLVQASACHGHYMSVYYLLLHMLHSCSKPKVCLA